MAITTASVAAALGIAPATDTDTAWLQTVTDAAADYVAHLPHAAELPQSHADLGATMLAVRLYHSRSAPLGAAGVDVVGGLIRASTDPEIARYLRIGRYTAPRVG